jgi:hypothetical protein
LLSAEKVKTFYILDLCAEPTVQHEEAPQPPPENPCEGMDEAIPPPEPEEQQNEDIIFFTSFDAHFGQFVSCSEALTV